MRVGRDEGNQDAPQVVDVIRRGCRAPVAVGVHFPRIYCFVCIEPFSPLAKKSVSQCMLGAMMAALFSNFPTRFLAGASLRWPWEVRPHCVFPNFSPRALQAVRGLF